MNKYNSGGSTSTVDQGTGSVQLTDYYYIKKALVEAREEQYFMQLADVTAMPKNMGKKIVMYHYVPLLDDDNINDQGIDATGAVSADGNLYGSSRDIGVIPDKLPVLSETGGRVNRVGFSRKVLEGTFENFGLFSEYTEDAMNFDSDADLMTHINRETINGASELTEDALQIDLINNAGTIRYLGAATNTATTDSLVTYGDLVRLNIDLDNNRTPKHTKVITGTRNIDTKTIAAARVMYIGSELLPTLKAMKDFHDNAAFIPAQHYASQTTLLTGEVGSIDAFRIVVVPKMLKWAGAGAASTDATKYLTGGNLDVFPMLVVGDGSFTTIGFQTNGKTVKFNQIHKAPGKETADMNNPYGKKGFMSIQWWYGFMPLRPERIALIKTTATM
jgi:N4-gp56 family major capsid protein